MNAKKGKIAGIQWDIDEAPYVWVSDSPEFAELLASATDRERLQLAHELQFCEQTRHNIAYFKRKRLMLG